MTTMMTFVKQCFKAYQTTGAIAPSSRALGAQIFETGNIADDDVVIEFGPGTGVLTEVFLERISDPSKFMAIEINKEFCDLLNKRFPDANIIHDDATNARKHLEALGYEHCDCILSGLPWALFDDSIQDPLLDTIIDILKPGGRFVTFTYVTSPMTTAGRRFRAKIRERFSSVEKTGVIWQNFPPAFNYRAIK